MEWYSKDDWWTGGICPTHHLTEVVLAAKIWSSERWVEMKLRCYILWNSNLKCNRVTAFPSWKLLFYNFWKSNTSKTESNSPWNCLKYRWYLLVFFSENVNFDLRKSVFYHFTFTFYILQLLYFVEILWQIWCNYLAKNKSKSCIFSGSGLSRVFAGWFFFLHCHKYGGK